MNNIMFDGTQSITIGNSIFITIISMSIVFFVLSLISFTLSFFKYMPLDAVESKVKKDKKTSTTSAYKEEKIFDSSNIKDDRMRAAIIVATIEASSETEEEVYIKINSVKELN